MNHNFMDQVAKWQQDPFDKETQENVNALLNNPKALEDAFYTISPLELGECVESWGSVPTE